MASRSQPPAWVWGSLTEIGLVPVGCVAYYGGEGWGAVAAVAFVIACGLWVAWSSHVHVSNQKPGSGGDKHVK